MVAAVRALERLGRPGRLSIARARQLTRVLVGLRWFALLILGVVGIVLLAAGPPMPHVWAPMIGLMLGQATYNGWIALHIDRIADAHVYAVARVATLLDMLTVITLMTLLALPQIQCAPYIFMMLEAVAYDGVVAGVASVVLFAGGLVVIGLGRNALYHLPLNGWEAFFWFLLVVAAAVLFPVVSQVLLERDTDDVPADPARQGSLRPASTVHLSVREHEVLRLVANGCSNTMIASRLHLRESTVKSYVESTLTRLGARTRAEAVATASRLNLL